MNESKRLWYRRPAESWMEGLPIGNGRLGAMAMGGVNEDCLYLNEESIWEGHPGECRRENPYEAVKRLQDVLFEGDSDQAEKIVMEEIIPEKRWFGSYQTLGELRIRNIHPIEYDSYRRELDLEQALTRTVFSKDFGQNSGEWEKEYFVSAVHQVTAVRYARSETSPLLDLDICLDREQDSSVTIENGDTLYLEGQCGGNGIRFACRVKAVVRGGTVSPHYVRMHFGPSLQIRGAESLEIYISARTDFTCGKYLEQCKDDISAAVLAGYEKVKEKHIREYRSYFNRFELRLGGKVFGEEVSEKETAGADREEYYSTAQRLERLQAGTKDEKFYELFFNYQRYLLISSSRPGCRPSNLQGIWNYQYKAPWESDYHVNINLQMNYWPAEAYHLSECVEPLLEYVKLLAEDGRKTAQEYYHARGFVVHHASNLFGDTAPVAGEAGMWPMGGAWIVRHLFEHYLYTGDVGYLEREGYPLMKDAAFFILDFLREIPEGRPWAGYLTTNPSHSPENQLILPDGRKSYFTYGAAMDYEIIRDLFENCRQSAEILRGINGNPEYDREFLEEMDAALGKLPPIRISSRTGGIMEWLDDYEEAEIGHRHVSHLYSLYPARQITPENNPVLAEGARRTLDRRLQNGYDGQAWSYGWISALWARLGEPEKAYAALEKIMQNHVCFNLFVIAHGNPQVGDAQGVPAAVVEMLVQYEDGKLRLLPALPQAWRDGAVRGLRTVGGYEISMEWKNGRVISLDVDKSRAFMDLEILY